MNIFIIDISGKVIKYDIALCEAIQMQLNAESSVSYISPLYEEQPRCRTIRLFNIVPKKYKNGEYLWKRALKFLELILNNIYVICFVAWKNLMWFIFNGFLFLRCARGTGGRPGGSKIKCGLLLQMSEQQGAALKKQNSYDGKNDEQFKAIIDYFKREMDVNPFENREN